MLIPRTWTVLLISLATLYAYPIRTNAEPRQIKSVEEAVEFLYDNLNDFCISDLFAWSGACKGYVLKVLQSPYTGRALAQENYDLVAAAIALDDIMSRKAAFKIRGIGFRFYELAIYGEMTPAVLRLILEQIQHLVSTDFTGVRLDLEIIKKKDAALQTCDGEDDCRIERDGLLTPGRERFITKGMRNLSSIGDGFEMAQTKYGRYSNDSITPRSPLTYYVDGRRRVDVHMDRVRLAGHDSFRAGWVYRLRTNGLIIPTSVGSALASFVREGLDNSRFAVEVVKNGGEEVVRDAWEFDLDIRGYHSKRFNGQTIAKFMKRLAGVDSGIYKELHIELTPSVSKLFPRQRQFTNEISFEEPASENPIDEAKEEQDRRNPLFLDDAIDLINITRHAPKPGQPLKVLVEKQENG